MKALLGNKVNDFCLPSALLFVKCFFNSSSSFWLPSFWGCSLEFLSIITASVNWGTVFDLQILTWLLLHTKLSSYLILQKFGFLVCFALKAFPCRDSFLDLNAYFALVYLLHYCFSKNVFEINLFSFKLLIIL